MTKFTKANSIRSRLLVPLMAGACLSIAVLPSAAYAQDNTQLSEAEAQAQYKALAAEETSRAGDPAFDYQLGITALDAGYYGEAVIAFQRVLAVEPDNAPARAELARAYALAGDIDTARAQFATVMDDPSLPDPVRQRFTGFVRQFDKQISGGGSDVSGFVEASSGHDSNINAATDLTQITIPLFAAFGPGTLGAGARAQDDEYWEMGAGVSGVSAISRQDRVFASALGNYHDNFDSAAFDIASLTGTAGYAHSFANRDVISLSAQVQKFWLGQSSYRTAYGAIAQYTHRLAGGKALTLSGQYNRLDFNTDPLRDADRFSLGVGYVTRHMSASVTAGHEETLAQAGDAQSNSFATANIGAELPIGEGVAVVAGAAFDMRRYDQADVLFLTKRQDERLDASLGLKVAVLPNVIFNPRASFSRNWSNIALYDFDRWTVSAGLRFEF